MITSSTIAWRPVPGTAAHALLDAAAADPHAPLALALTAPGGHGKTFVLRELARTYRRAGVPVLTSVPEPGTPVEPVTVLLIDDAHLLDDSHLRTLRGLADANHRLAVAQRPGPWRADLFELTETLRRRGSAPLLAPFTPEQTAACLAAVPEVDRQPDLPDVVHRETGGVPRDVARLVRALSSEAGAAGQPPRSAVLELGPDLAAVSADARRLLIALAAGPTVPVDLLADLLDRAPEAVDDLVAEAAAAGLLGPDQQVTPLVRRAVVALAPTAERTAVWRRLTELQLARGGPVLPTVRAIAPVGGRQVCPAPVLTAAAEEALATEPALAAELLATATAAGHPIPARQAFAAALAGDLDAALRLADRLLAGADPSERAEAAQVAATALAHRGQVRRSVELYRWSGNPSSVAFAAVGALATGRPAAELPPVDDPAAPPSLHGSAARLMAEGVRDSLDGPPTAALSTLVQAAALLEPDGRALLLPDSPAALAALTGLHCGELDIAEGVLDRAVASGVGGPLMVPRHRLLQAWIAMLRGRTLAAADALAEVAAGQSLESRDLLFAAALQLGVARRNSDLAGLRRGWERALEAVVRHPVDLFTLLPLGELAVVAARLGDLPRLEPYLREARDLLARLGDPPLWSTPWHWSGLHAAILADQPVAADEHVAALLATADRSRYAAVVAAAAASWVDVLRGAVDPARVETAARGLHDVGLRWDAARLAGQAAIRTADRRAMTALLECARMFQERPVGPRNAPEGDRTGTEVAGPRHRLSEREQEVAELVVAGLTYREIGDRLFISAKTVEHHVARMRSRLNCANRAELLALLRTVVADRSSSAAGRFWPQRSAG